MFKRSFGILCVLMSFTFTIYSQVNDSISVKSALSMSLEELLKVKVEISSVKPVDLLSTSSAVSIIDREAIERYNYSTVAEALSMVPGIDVLQTTIDWNVTTARGILQNFYANKILLMINSVPTWQPIYGDGHLERIAINDVERIEVIKGPASVLYGSNAYAGVVNIILRDKKERVVDAYVESGLPTLFSGGINVLTSKNDFSLYIGANASFEDRKPYEMKADSNFPYLGDTTYMYNERYQIGNLIVRGVYKSHSLMINSFNFDHTHFGAYPSYAMGGGTTVDNSGVLINYQFNGKIAPNVHFLGNVSYDYFNRHFTISADRSNLVKITGARSVVEGKFDVKVSDLVSFEIGGHGELRDSYGHETRNGVTDVVLYSNLSNDDNTYEASLFLQPEINFGSFSFFCGGRYTYNSLFGDDISFRGTGLYRINLENSIKLMAGQSFRVPTMFELYSIHPTVKGNRELKPEKSESLELAYLMRKKNIFFQAVAYLSSYSDLIERVSYGDSLQPEYMNTNNFMGQGLEVEFSYRKENRGSFYINYNYVEAFNDKGVMNYKYVPDHTVSFGLFKDVRQFFVFSKGQVVSATSGLYKEIPAQFYFDFGVGLNAQIKDLKFKHMFTVKNVTSSKYLTSQYIRPGDVNELPTMGFGRRFIYTLVLRY